MRVDDPHGFADLARPWEDQRLRVVARAVLSKPKRGADGKKSNGENYIKHVDDHMAPQISPVNEEIDDPQVREVGARA